MGSIKDARYPSTLTRGSTLRSGDISFGAYIARSSVSGIRWVGRQDTGTNAKSITNRTVVLRVTRLTVGFILFEKNGRYNEDECKEIRSMAQTNEQT